MAPMSCSTNPGIILLVIASLLAVTQGSTVTFGGPQHWRYGFNYTDWAIKNSPFYIQDTLGLALICSSMNTVQCLLAAESVQIYDLRLQSSGLLANPTQGKGEGFAVVINQERPCYVASGEGDDSENGMMKFFIAPVPRLTGR
ncbi:hypothetical protein SLEP1_g16816 [Rubroshorea leprosula]|uniref:Phytocyanin domain-containing protein n=1 Tax=Rubroshorea leprosula TaxID=152421 RepID=A0AAV5J1A7_9ROSI|nr:hypothetical protein SLEP1_g16816 [Rubroshorea leprosula]